MNNVVSYLSQKTRKNTEQKQGGLIVSHFLSFFRERSSLSLNFRQIRPSKFFGARRKAALRIEAYAWVPVSWSFDKLREVGDLSYLSFTLYLSVFMMFELIEAVSDYLIGPKSWNRIIRKF